MLTNLYKSFNFELERQRDKMIAALSTEYLQMLAILYGDQIQSGTIRTSAYNTMTMLEVADELRIRTMMMRGERLRKKRRLTEEHAANEAALLERLKRIS